MLRERHLPLTEALKGALRGRVVVVGIGNPCRGDDGAGPRVARLLERLLPASPPGEGIVASIAAETTPEAHAGRIAALRPDTVLLVDAVDLGAPPGTVALLGEAELTGRTGWSVHRPPLLLLMQYLTLRTGARSLLLGVQAAETEWGAQLTPPVRAATSAVVRSLRHWHEGDCRPGSREEAAADA